MPPALPLPPADVLVVTAHGSPARPRACPHGATFCPERPALSPGTHGPRGSHRAPPPSSSHPGVGLSPRCQWEGAPGGCRTCPPTQRPPGGWDRQQDIAATRSWGSQPEGPAVRTHHAVVFLQRLALPRRAAEAAGAGGGAGDVRPPVFFQLNERPGKGDRTEQALSLGKPCSLGCDSGDRPSAHPRSKAAAARTDPAGCLNK